MSTRPTDRPGEEPADRFTVVFVPDGGRSEPWQRSFRLRTVRLWLAAAATAFAVLLVLAGVQSATLPRVLDHDALVGENLGLHARLVSIEREIASLEPLVQRVRAYDDKLRELETRKALPGFGPLDPEEAIARRAWLDGVVPSLTPDPTTDHSLIEANLSDAQARLAILARDLEELAPRADALNARLAEAHAEEDVLPHLWPVEGVLTSPFGWRKSPYGPGWKFHTGLDIGIPRGTPILATNEGIVTFAGWDSGHGYTVDVDHGRGVATRYCHASQILVAAGDEVNIGDTLALSGSTGLSTGPHLHFELSFDGEKVDPLPYMPETGN